VHLSQRFADLRIRKSAQPTWTRGVTKFACARSHRDGEEHVREAINDGRAAGQILRGFRCDELQSRLNPRRLIKSLLSEEANAKHPAITDVAGPSPPWNEISRDLRNSSSEQTSSTERIATSGWLRRS
jgi:hypothetical protein